MVDTIADGKIIEKLDPTASTPSLVYTRDVFYMMSNVSEKVNVKWYLGEFNLSLRSPYWLLMVFRYPIQRH